jgi:GNAT superfamily N-acetyltransferase
MPLYKAEHVNMMHVERMKVGDIPFAVQLANDENWELAKEDFEFTMELEPEGCFVLSDNSKRIGLATNVIFDKIAWFGNLVVSETHRNKGAGSLLVEHSIDYLRSRKVQTIGLYAYAERIPFYTRLGFTRDSDFLVLTGMGLSFPPKPNVRLARKTDVKKIVSYDQVCFGASRKKLLEPIILDPDNLCYMYIKDGKVSGYVVAKVYRGVAELGPLACPRKSSGIAVDLLETALNRLKGLEVSMFVPEKESAILNMLEASKFVEKFRVARMLHGPHLTDQCTFMAESLERG